MRVEWTEEGLDRLADIYVTLDLAGQDEIARAVASINTALARDPWELGESRGRATRRSWFADPLTVLFDIDEGDDVVVVHHVAIKRPKRA